MAKVTDPVVAPELVMVCEGILPEPLAEKPVIWGEEAVATQVKVVPCTLPVKVMGGEAVPLHMVCGDTGLGTTAGLGLMVIMVG